MPKTESPTRAGLAVALVVALLVSTLVVFRPGDQASAGVSFSDPEAWIEHGLEGELLKVNGSTGEVTTRIDVADDGADLSVAAHGSGAALINRTAGQLTLIDGQRLTPTLQLDLELSSDPEDRSLQVHPSPDFDSAVIVSDSDQIMVVDPQTSVVESIPLPQPLGSMATEASGRFIGLVSETDALVSVANQRFEVLDELPPAVEDGEPRRVVSAGGEAFLVDPARLMTSPVLQTGELGNPFCLAGAAAQGALFGGSGANEDPLIVSFSAGSGTVSLASPTTGCEEITLTTNPTDEFGEPVVHEGFVYLPNYSLSQVHVIDIAEQAQVSIFGFGTNNVPFGLEVRGAAVWANQPLGASAAVIEGGQITRVVKIESVVAGAVQFDAEGGEGEEAVGPGGDVEDEGGLRILGASGQAVLAAGEDPNAASGEASEGGLAEGEDPDSDLEEPLEPVGVGVPAEALQPLEATPEPAVEPEALIEPESNETPAEETEQLIANFAASAVTANVGESIRFTDFSSGSPTSWTWDFGDGTGARDLPVVTKEWDEGGTFVVSLIVTNGSGAESRQTVEIEIVSEEVAITPTADFGFDRDTIEVGESVTFTSRSTGSPESLQWNFGDGSGDLGEVVTHRYDEPGTYNVRLTAASAVGSTTASTVITVLSDVDAPVAVIGDIPSDIVAGQLVTFTSEATNNPTSVTWDFGDGGDGTGERVRHRFEDASTYRVRLEVSNSAGSDSAFVDVQVQRRIDPPVALFTQTATEVSVGDLVTFTDLSTNNPTSWAWDFGDGTTRRVEVPNKRWSEAGTYRVVLEVANNAGSARTSVTITVVDPIEAPSAVFALSSGVVAPGEVVSFTDRSQSTPTQWAWDFGDGNTTSVQSPTHAYTEPGTYQVTLRASNPGGDSTASQQVIVADRPVANFDFVVDGRTVSFTDSSTSAEQWEWDFGDGTTSPQRSPQHTFESGGVFNVTLVVRNQVGTSAPRAARIRVAEPAVAVASCTSTGRTLECDGSASENAVEFLWVQDNAAINTTPNAAQTVLAFAFTGRPNVTLRVTAADGSQDETTIRAPRVQAGLDAEITDVNVAQEGDLVRLTAVFENDPVRWNWELNGAELVEGGNGPTAVFRVPDDGRYTGEVWAENAFGRDADRLQIDVQSFAPEASFTWEVVGPGLVQFENTSQVADDFAVTWRTPGSVDIPARNRLRTTVQYPLTGGRFDVSLEVRDEFGTDTFEATIVVPNAEPEPPPAQVEASFTWSIIGPGLVEAINTSTAPANADVRWQAVGEESQPVRTADRFVVEFDEGGTYEIRLFVTSDEGDDQLFQPVVVPDF